MNISEVKTRARDLRAAVEAYDLAAKADKAAMGRAMGDAREALLIAAEALDAGDNTVSSDGPVLN